MTRPLLEIFDEVRRAHNNGDAPRLHELHDEFATSSEGSAAGWHMITEAYIQRLTGNPKDCVDPLKRAQDFFHDSDDVDGKAYSIGEYARWSRLGGGAYRSGSGRSYSLS